MCSKLGLPPRIYGAHLTRLRRRSTMGKTVLWLLLSMTVAPWLRALPAQAQAMRTYISGLDKDSHPCAATGQGQPSDSSVTGMGPGWLVVKGGKVLIPRNNPTAGNTRAITATPPAAASTPPPTPTSIAKNIVTDFGAKCNGVTD